MVRTWTAGSPCGAGSRFAQTPELLDSQKAGAHGGTPALRGLVHEVLGVNPAPREQVCEPNRRGDMASVQVAQPVCGLRLGIVQALHPRSGQGSLRVPHAIP